MMMSSHPVRLLVFLLGMMVLKAPAQERLDSEIREKLREATVYIQTRLDEQGGTGSGFVVKTVGEVVYIATNQHVIDTSSLGSSVDSQRARLKVVFDGETEPISADLMAADEEHDLAILRVFKKDPPAPFELFSKRPLEETMPVTVFGYPLGDPSITINTAETSSFVHNDVGAMARIKIFGKVDPGNSGGPIVDLDGAIVGVTVEKDRRADNIGYAIPAFELHELMRGRLGNFKIDQEGSDLAYWCRMSASVLDPLKRLEKVTARVIAKKDLSDDSLKSAVSDNGQIWRLLADSMETHELELGSDTIEQEFVLKGVQGDVYFVQFEYERKDEPSSISEPLPIVLGGRDKIGEADRRIPLPVTEVERLRGAPVAIEGYRIFEWKVDASKVVPQIVWDEERIFLYLAESEGLIRKIDITKHQQNVSLNLGTPIEWCGYSGEGVVVFSNEAQEMWVLDNDTLRARHLHKMEGVQNLATSGKSFYAFATADDGKELRVYDLVDGTLMQTYTADALGAPGSPTSDSTRLGTFDWVGFTPTGTHLLVASGGGLHRFSVTDDELTYEEAGPVLAEEGARFELSDDARYVSFFADKTAQVFELNYLSEPLATLEADSPFHFVEVAEGSRAIFASTETTPLIRYDLGGKQERTFAEISGGHGVQLIPYQRVGGIFLVLTKQKLYFMQQF